MKVLVGFFAVLAIVAVGFGCQKNTPEQQEKADKSKAAVVAAAEVLEVVQTLMDKHVQEYNAIKVRVDAGESIPAVLADRYVALNALISNDVVVVKDAVDKYDAAKEADKESADAGVAWYNRIPWIQCSVILVAILTGAAGTYFPVAVPALKAVQSVITVIRGVSAKDAAAGKALKVAVLDASRALGVEAKVDALVQKYDPPKSKKPLST